MGEVVSQSSINRARIILGFQLRLINPDQLPPLPRPFAENIITDAIEPGRKLRLSAEAADIFVAANKCLLREIVGQRFVPTDELSLQTADGRLMTTHELGKSVVVVINENPGNEVC